MPMNVNQFIGAGLKDAKIKISTGVTYDIFGVVSAVGDPDRDEIEVKGDDEVKGIFTMGLKETITIESNALSFDVIQAITGNSVSSSATGSEIALGTDSEMNPPIVEVQAYTIARSADGTSSVIKKTWFKVQLGKIKVEQAGENEFKFSCEGTAFPTSTNVTGAALDSKRIATLNVYAGTIA